MKRLLLVVLSAAGLASAGACDKPLADDCKKAITNMQKLMGTAAVGQSEANDGEVRRCRGGSTREAVACAMKATSVDELKACEFMGAKKPTAQ